MKMDRNHYHISLVPLIVFTCRIFFGHLRLNTIIVAQTRFVTMLFVGNLTVINVKITEPIRPQFVVAIIWHNLREGWGANWQIYPRKLSNFKIYVNRKIRKLWRPKTKWRLDEAQHLKTKILFRNETRSFLKSLVLYKTRLDNIIHFYLVDCLQ